jgi:hypothetical protein
LIIRHREDCEAEPKQDKAIQISRRADIDGLLCRALRFSQ